MGLDSVRSPRSGNAPGRQPAKRSRGPGRPHDDAQPTGRAVDGVEFIIAHAEHAGRGEG